MFHQFQIFYGGPTSLCVKPTGNILNNWFSSIQTGCARRSSIRKWNETEDVTRMSLPKELLILLNFFLNICRQNDKKLYVQVHRFSTFKLINDKLTTNNMIFLFGNIVEGKFAKQIKRKQYNIQIVSFTCIISLSLWFEENKKILKNASGVFTSTVGVSLENDIR